MTQNEIAKRVIEERVRRGMSQEDLAGESLLSLRTIQRIESGQTSPRGDTLKRLAATLKVPVEDLIGWDLQEDANLVVLLNLTQLSFLGFVQKQLEHFEIIINLSKKQITDKPNAE